MIAEAKATSHSYYRRTSREAKRLESILRSFLYASFMEALDGIATIRAFKAQQRFVDTIQTLADTTNSAYAVTIAAQRWLSVRVDAIGNVIILGIGLASVGFRETQNPATLVRRTRFPGVHPVPQLMPLPIFFRASSSRTQSTSRLYSRR